MCVFSHSLGISFGTTTDDVRVAPGVTDRALEAEYFALIELQRYQGKGRDCRRIEGEINETMTNVGLKAEPLPTIAKLFLYAQRKMLLVSA